MPDRHAPAGRRFFTLDEANKMLPLVRHIVDDISNTARLYERLQNKLNMKNDLAPSQEDRRLLERLAVAHGDHHAVHERGHPDGGGAEQHHLSVLG